MKISIVTPCLNAGRFLEDCLASVRYGLQGLDYEHVVVDGGSTDGTLDTLKKAVGLRWVSEKDEGMYDALNKAVSLATGDIIGHLNTDEQYNRKGLRQALQGLADSAVDAVFGPTVMLDGTGKFLQLFKQIVVPRVADTYWFMPVQSCSLLYRRNIWERHAYDTQYRLAGDHAWFRWQMEHGLRLVGVREPIGLFVWHGENLSRTLAKHRVEDVLADLDRGSLGIKLTKHWYRWRKLMAGGYRREPVTYEQMVQGQPQTFVVRRPRLKLPKGSY